MAHITRLAPSPTGALHLGNARTFLVNWLLARQRGWRILLRIEDIDGPRIKRGAAQEILHDLRWLGLDWDDGPFYQSHHLEIYREDVERLLRSGHAYPCVCSRKEAERAASAPHAEDQASVYPGTCRDRYESIEAARKLTRRDPAIRFKMPAGIVEFQDGFAGPQRFDLAALGDFVIEKADRTPAYQLAVVVDDSGMMVDRVVRGDDLLDSTPRQIALHRALGILGDVPEYFHLPLIVGSDGRRLAKRHGDTRLSFYRDRGTSATAIIALLARWSGMGDVAPGSRPRDLIDSFKLEAMPRQPIVFTPEDNAWLLSDQR